MIENPKSSRVRKVAALARKKDRLESERFLVEGPQAVRELLVHRSQHALTVYATTGDEPWQFEIDRVADAAGVEIVRVTEQVLAAMADTVQPQGVLAVAEIERPSLTGLLQHARLVAVLHEVRDPGNAGAVLRAADAAGADLVVFSGASVDPWNPKVVRSTTGSIFHVPVVVVDALEDLLAASRAAGLTIIAADVNGEDLRPADPVLAERLVWVFGNEAHGLTPADREAADRVLRLPLFGAAESLNLATAASVLLYQSAFAQHGRLPA